jgi:hydrogenase nickel incorporation protein HypB
MCGTCGCGEENKITYRKAGEKEKLNLEHAHSHSHGNEEYTHDHHHGHLHDHFHEHDHNHATGHATIIPLERNILSKNDLLAERNRGFFEGRNIKAYNLVSSPGSGKTSILERTIREKGTELNCFVIEGDQQTMNDANRIKAAGAPAIQINTGTGCHLDASMVYNAVKALDVSSDSILFIENVGNLVCPSMFDLGESKRVVIISVTEGDDKPAKYPDMFQSSHLCLINKIDLLPYVDFSVENAKETALRVNHHLEFIELSAKTGEGMDKWYQWLANIKTS